MTQILNQIFNNNNPDIGWLQKHTLFLTIAGSKAYGLDTPESDIDVRGITSVPKNYLFGFNKNFDEFIKSDPDCVIFFSA